MLSRRNHSASIDPSPAQPAGGPPEYGSYTGPAASGNDARPRPAGQRSGLLKVPFNWDLGLIEKVADINRRPDTLYRAAEFYAADRRSVIGSGRDAESLPDRPYPLEDYVQECTRHGLVLDYVLNAPMLVARQVEQAMRQVESLLDAGIRTFTVGNPLLAERMRGTFPGVHLTCSVNLKVDSCERARQAMCLAAFDTILLDNRRSRDFPLMRELHRRLPQVDFAVLVNESCLNDCLLQLHHQDLLAQCSRVGGLEDGGGDWPHDFCTRMKLQHPEYVMKAPWIRPEDLHYVFEAGVAMAKIAGRTETSDWIVEATTAYATGKFSGDIWRLIEKSGLTSPCWERKAGRKLPPVRYRVNNAALDDGFIKPFVVGAVPCVNGSVGCGNCTHCARWTAKAVQKPDNAAERLRDLDDLAGAA